MRDDKPKPEPITPPTEAELSRIAREAVHQAPDSRLDRQLIRMGVMDAEEPAEIQPAQPAPTPAAALAADPELDRLRGEIRRTRQIVWALVVVIVVLAVVIIGLLVR